MNEGKSKGNFHSSKASKHASFLKEAIQGCVQSSNFSLFTHPLKKQNKTKKSKTGTQQYPQGQLFLQQLGGV